MTYSKRIDKNKLFRALMVFSLTLFMLIQACTMTFSYLPSEEREYRTVVVRSGDTLWSIAESMCDGDVRKEIKDIKKFNNLKSDTLNVGDHIKVPLYD